MELIVVVVVIDVVVVVVVAPIYLIFGCCFIDVFLTVVLMTLFD